MPTYDFSGLDQIKGPQYNFDGLDKVGAPTTPENDGVLDKLKAAGLGAADYNTLGTASEIYGGVAAGANKLKDAVTGENSGDLTDLYRKYQQQASGAMKESEAAHPYLYHGAGIGSSLLTGNAAMDALGIGKLGAVSGGAAIGAITGAAKSEHNLDGVEGAEGIAGDAAKGAAFGAATGAVIHGAVKGAQKLGEVSGINNWGSWLADKMRENPSLKSRIVTPAEEGFNNATGIGADAAVGGEGGAKGGADYTDEQSLKQEGLADMKSRVGGEQGGKIDDIGNELGQRTGNVVQAADEIPTLRFGVDKASDAVMQIERLQADDNDPLLEKIKIQLQRAIHDELPEAVENAERGKWVTTEVPELDEAGEPTGEMIPGKSKETIKRKPGITDEELLAAEEREGDQTNVRKTDADGTLLGTSEEIQKAKDVNRPGILKSDLTASELYKLTDEIQKLKKYAAKNNADPSVMKVLYDLQAGLRQDLSKIPGYDQVAEHYSTFLRDVPEQILAGTKTPEDAGIRYTDLKNGRGDVIDQLGTHIDQAAAQGPVSDTAVSLDKIQAGLDHFQKYEQLRQAQAVLKGEKFEPVFNKLTDSPESFVQKIKDSSDRYNAAQQATAPGSGRVASRLDSTTGIAAAVGLHTAGPVGALAAGGLAMALRPGAQRVSILANQAGKRAGQAVNLGHALVGAGEETLQNVSQTLKSTPGLRHLGEALDKAVSNKSDFLKNASIFSILQNPDARKTLGF